MTLNKEMFFTHQTVVNSVLGYFSGVSAIKWEFSTMTQGVDHYVVIVQISNSATDALIGNIVIVYLRGSNDVRRIYYMPGTEMRPDPSMVYMQHVWIGDYTDVNVWAGMSRKTADPNMIYIRPTIHLYEWYSSPGNDPKVVNYEWNLNTTIGVTAFYKDNIF